MSSASTRSTSSKTAVQSQYQTSPDYYTKQSRVTDSSCALHSRDYLRYAWQRSGLGILVVRSVHIAGSVLRLRRLFSADSGYGVLGGGSDDPCEESVGILQLLAERSYGSRGRTVTLRDDTFVVGNGRCGCVASMRSAISMRGSLGDLHRASAYYLRGVWVSGELFQIDA